MDLEHLDLAEVLDFRPDQGIIRLHEQRVVILSAAAMGLLRKELIDTLGLETARRLMLRFGYADGYHDAVSLRDRSKWASPLEGLRAGAVLHRLEGIVRAEITKVEHDATSGRFEEEVVWHDSYVAEQHVHHYGKSDAPVCWSLVGYASGYVERLSRTGDLLPRNRVPGARRAEVLGRWKGCCELGRRAGGASVRLSGRGPGAGGRTPPRSCAPAPAGTRSPRATRRKT